MLRPHSGPQELGGPAFTDPPEPPVSTPLFIRLWREAYADFDDSDWNRHSVVVPMRLARRHPQLVHVDWFSINRPNWDERRWLYTRGQLWDWSRNYAVHRGAVCRHRYRSN